MYKTILFDLDGTLTDSGKGITNSVRYALKKYGIEDPEQATLFKFVGPPLIASFQKYYGFSEEQAREAVVYYREYYTTKGIFENEVYEGVEETLRKLKEAGYRLVLATAKPEKFAKIVIEHFGLEHYFDLIAGAALDETRTNKAEVIAYALESLNITDKISVVMVGDREDDVNGAKRNGLACIGVLYGYGDREELEQAGASYIVEQVEELVSLLEKKEKYPL